MWSTPPPLSCHLPSPPVTPPCALTHLCLSPFLLAFTPSLLPTDGFLSAIQPAPLWLRQVEWLDFSHNPGLVLDPLSGSNPRAFKRALMFPTRQLKGLCLQHTGGGGGWREGEGGYAGGGGAEAVICGCCKRRGGAWLCGPHLQHKAGMLLGLNSR
jgi:hypothetical protein